MLTDFVNNLLTTILSFYTNVLHPHIANLLSHIMAWQTYTADFKTYLGGVYYVLGKPLIVFIVVTFSLILVVRLVFAIVWLVGQFVP